MGVKVLGTIGDVNVPEYDGGFILELEDGSHQIEWCEPPCDDVDEDSEDARWTVYRVDCDPSEVDWADLAAAASTVGRTKAEIEADLQSGDPMRVASAIQDVVALHSWGTLDQYPLELTREEAEERYAAEPYCSA